MPIVRGFVQRLDVGRAGLVAAALIETTGSINTYVIEDLDADPERFNERLSKLAILRDAMDRAEPVEIQYEPSESGDSIVQVGRLSRDELDTTLEVRTADGLVIDVVVEAKNGLVGPEEAYDQATIMMFTTDSEILSLTLNLQIPERNVSQAQLNMLLDGYKEGKYVRVAFTIEDAHSRFRGRIVAVSPDVAIILKDSEQYQEVHGFAETLNLIPLPSAAYGSLATIRLTTAPDFTGPGNTVGMSPYVPKVFDLIIPKKSAAYYLFEAALRDNLRVRVMGMNLGYRRESRETHDVRDRETLDDVEEVEETDEQSGNISIRAMNMAMMPARGNIAAAVDRRDIKASHDYPSAEQNVMLVIGVELLAPLASASRPVWIDISRESLDYGPDYMLKTRGLPSSDLKPRSLRDLRIPYPAAWHGIGCFNVGVYRFQFNLPVDFRVLVDGEELCVHETEIEPVTVAHACLGGEHHVVVELREWICDYTFDLDVYRLR